MRGAMAGFLAGLVLAGVLGVEGAGEQICNMPFTGTLLAGDASAPYTTVRLSSSASVFDNYYVGSRLNIASGTGAGASSTITAYCGQTHTSCAGLDSSGQLTAVGFTQHIGVGVVGANVNYASTLLVTLPALDGGGRTIPTAGDTTCADQLLSPYMTDYVGTDCTGSYQGLNMYITSGTGAGQIGLIRAGPDSNRKVLVTGLFGWCTGGVDATACQGNWHAGEANCKANNGARCNLDADCTGAGTCHAPVDTGSTFTVSIAQSAGSGSLCNPLCNGVASFTATVDFDVATDTTSSFSIQRGCYDERFAAGMRRLGASGSGAGQQNVHLDWKVLIPDGEIATKPLLLDDGSIIVGSVKGSLTKLAASGEKHWSIYVGMVMGNPAVGSDGTIYFGSGDRNVWAVTSQGITRWRYTTPMPVHGSPLVTDTGVYIGDRNGTFYRFNLDGSVAWKFYTDGEILGGSAMTRDGRVVFGSMDKYFYCLNASTGQALWSITAGQEIVGTPLVQDVSIVFGTRESDDEYGQVIALKMDGTVRWKYTASSSIESLPAEGSNGEVYVATTDGKILSIQADGQLLWRYNTGGTGGVCKQASYASHSLAVATGQPDNAETASATEKSFVTLSSTASAEDSAYTGFRAAFTIASGFLTNGQFLAVDSIEVTYGPVVAIHDTDFTDSAGQDTAIALSFTTKDRMIAGETITITLPGMFQASDTTIELYPQDLSAACNAGAGTPCKSAGMADFAGVTGFTAQSGTTISVVLSATAGENCAVNDACAGSKITFLSGTGSGQVATILAYLQSSKTATITYITTAADATTTYKISAAPVSKFTAAFTAGSAAPGTLELTVASTTGTADCGSGCSQLLIKLAGAEVAAAGALDGYLIEFVSGTGVGQSSTCIRYYGAADAEKCDIDKVQIPPDGTTVYRIGPQVAAGEEVTLVVKYGQTTPFKYPAFSGLATGGTTTTVIMGADAGPEVGFYVGMEMEVQLTQVAILDSGGTGVAELYSNTVVLDVTPANYDIIVGAYLLINSELMKVTVLVSGNIITVLRAQRGTAAQAHAASDPIEVIYYSTISAYDGSTLTATVDTLGRAAAAGDLYRVHGGTSVFSFRGATAANFATTPVPFGTAAVPSEYSTFAGSVKLAAPEVGDSNRADEYYTGAVLSITSGPGEGLRGKILSYVEATAVATVEFTYEKCGGLYFCGPKGIADNGYLSTPTSAFPVSKYTITVDEVVSSYVGSSKILTLGQLATKIPDTINYCSVEEASAGRYCTTYATIATPVRLEWQSGGWCGASGGTGWGATSPCFANGLVVTTSSNKFVYGLGADGTVKFKHMTGKRIQSPPRCVTNADKTVTIYTGSNDHFVYRLSADAQKVLRGSSWYTQ